MHIILSDHVYVAYHQIMYMLHTIRSDKMMCISSYQIMYMLHTTHTLHIYYYYTCHIFHIHVHMTDTSVLYYTIYIYNIYTTHYTIYMIYDTLYTYTHNRYVGIWARDVTWRVPHTQSSYVGIGLPTCATYTIFICR